MGSETSLRAGVDIGGTFTDVCVTDGERIVAVGKGLTTPAEPAAGVEAVLAGTLASLGRPAEDVGQIVHGTTLVTNALLERRGARVALLATEGFRDVLEMGRERRADLYDLMVEHPRPLVARHLRFDVPERTLADGMIERPLDVAFVERLARELDEHGVEAVAVCFLHCFANPANERAARRRSSGPHRACGSRSPATWSLRSASTSARARRSPASMCTTSWSATFATSKGA